MLRQFRFIPFVSLGLVFFSLTFPQPAWALKPLFPTCSPTGNVIGPSGPVPPCSIIHIFGLLYNIYDYLITMAAAVAIVMLIVGGMMFMLGGTDTMLTTAKTTVTNALVGLVIILISYVLIYTLIFQILNLNCDKATNPILFEVFKGVGIFSSPPCTG